MTPPDSGEREVWMAKKECPRCHGIGLVTMTPASPEQNAKAEAILAELGGGVAVLPLSLAQRVLAALEEAYGFVPMAGKELQTLAGELRAVMPKGTR